MWYYGSCFLGTWSPASLQCQRAGTWTCTGQRTSRQDIQVGTWENRAIVCTSTSSRKVGEINGSFSLDLTTLACLLLNPETGLGSSHRFTHGIYVKMNTSTVINHQAKLLSPINKQLPCSSPAYYTRLLEIIFARGLQSFLNINSLLKVIHLGQWIFSQVSCSDQSVPSDLIICSSVNALMAPGYPDTAGQCWNDLPSRIMSSSGLLGNPCCCL